MTRSVNQLMNDKGFFQNSPGYPVLLIIRSQTWKTTIILHKHNVFQNKFDLNVTQTAKIRHKRCSHGYTFPSLDVTVYLSCDILDKNNGSSQNLKGKQMHSSHLWRFFPNVLVALLAIIKKFHSMESLANHNIGFKLIVLAILGLL